MAQIGGAVPMIVSAVITAASTYMQYQQGQETQAIAEHNKQIAENNARAMQEMAAVQARQERNRTMRLLAKQRMLFGKAGVTPEGTPLLVMEETAREGEKEALMIEYSGRIGQSRHRSQADIYSMKGRVAATAGTTTAFMTAGKGLLTVVESLPGE